MLLIAPETDACLANSIRWLGNQQHKLISPSLDFVVATSNKNQLANRLSQQGFNEVPIGMDLKSCLNLSGQQLAAWFPVVVKPADGAGSEGVEYFGTKAEFDTWLMGNAATQLTDFRVEQFVNGTPTSIAVVCREGREPIFFPAMKQILATHNPSASTCVRKTAFQIRRSFVQNNWQPERSPACQIQLAFSAWISC